MKDQGASRSQKRRGREGSFTREGRKKNLKEGKNGGESLPRGFPRRGGGEG